MTGSIPSPKHDELYHYDDGLFKAYPSDGATAFFTCHTLKVLAPDVELVTVSKSATHSCWTITSTLPLWQTPTEKALHPVLGTITLDQFQQMFKNAWEKTSLERALWTTPFGSAFPGVTISPPSSQFWSASLSHMDLLTHTGHICQTLCWKKTGVRQIHTLRIIGKVAAEFNTCLKFFIGHQAMHNFEDSDPCDFQHGFWPNGSSVNAAMLKLLTWIV